MNNIKQLKEQQKDIHPGFGSYLECMTRTLFTGLSAFCLSFSAFYFSQKLMQKNLPYPKKFNILLSTVGATGVAYKVTRDRTKACQAAWMAAEDKYTELKNRE